jgi:hypothetical protein
MGDSERHRIEEEVRQEIEGKAVYAQVVEDSPQRRRRFLIIGGVLVAAIIGGILGGVLSSHQDDKPASTTTLASAPSPTAPPASAEPTLPEECRPGPEVNCTIRRGTDVAVACEEYEFPEVELCWEMPTAVTLLYNGGGCDQTENQFELNILCRD